MPKPRTCCCGGGVVDTAHGFLQAAERFSLQLAAPVDSHVRRKRAPRLQLSRALPRAELACVLSASGDVVVLATGREADCGWPCGCVQLIGVIRRSTAHCCACADGSLSFHDAENGEVRLFHLLPATARRGLTRLHTALACTQQLLLRKCVHASPVSVLDWHVHGAASVPKLTVRLAAPFYGWPWPAHCSLADMLSRYVAFGRSRLALV